MQDVLIRAFYDLSFRRDRVGSKAGFDLLKTGPGYQGYNYEAKNDPTTTLGFKYSN